MARPARAEAVLARCGARNGERGPEGNVGRYGGVQDGTDPGTVVCPLTLKCSTHSWGYLQIRMNGDVSVGSLPDYH